MTITDDDHDVARIIKDLEERIADLERSGGGQTTPNLLRTESDRVTVGDTLNSVNAITLATATWDNKGWRTATWGSYA